VVSSWQQGNPVKGNEKCPEPINYFIDQSNGTVDLTLTDERLIAKTKGKGLIDKPRTINISLSDF